MANNQADHILSAAARLCLEQGLGALTMRSAAATAEVTASAIVYHFKTRERLLAAVLGRLAEGIEQSRRSLAAAFDAEQAAFADKPAMVSAILCRLVDQQGRATITLLELARLLRGSDVAQDSQTAMVQETGRADAFWQSLPHIAEEDPEERAIWAATAQGLISLAMLDRHPVARDARIVRVLSRLVDRLARREVALLPPVALPDQAAKVARPAGKQQIVDATIRLSGEGGIEPLTHRKIAAAAGLSVASTTYFYGSKEDIVVDAAQELQARTMDAVVHRRVPTSTMLSRITLDEKNEERAEIAALAAFSAAASRGDELSGLAASLRRLRGIDGARWLEARGGERIDRLDGMIWAAASTTLTQQALLRPAAERAKLLDECSEAWLVRLFG